MTNFLNKHFVLILTLLIVILPVTMWLLPSTARISSLVFICLGLTINMFLIIEKHRQAFLLGRISHVNYLSRICSWTAYVLLTVILAGIAGKYMAAIATTQINNEFAKFNVGILVGLLVGVSMSHLLRKTLDHFRII